MYFKFLPWLQYFGYNNTSSFLRNVKALRNSRDIIKVIILLLFCLLGERGFSQNKYRIKHLRLDGFTVNFEFPPHAKLGREGLFGNKEIVNFRSRFRFHTVTIKGISNNYQQSVERIEEACYKHSRSQRLHAGSSVTKIDSVAKLYLTNEDQNVIIEFDYTSLLDSLSKDLKYLERLSVRLLNGLSKVQDTLKFWPEQGICQNIVEKVFEYIPKPEYAVLSKFGTCITDSSSFVLLNPSIGLKIDHQDFYGDTKNQNNQFDRFNYYFTGQTTLFFYRDSEGHLKQSSFLDIEKNNKVGFLPINNAIRSTDISTHIQASSVDLQMSNSINRIKYVGLFQNYLKRNNGNSSEGISNAKLNKDDDLFIGNSYLILADTIQNLLSYPSKTSAVTKSTFGCGGLFGTKEDEQKGGRSVITPIFPIYINGNINYISVGTKLGSVLLNYGLAYRDLKIFRKYNGRMFKIKYKQNYFTLLPGDHLKSTL
ncbi:hypothetical protein [Pedobacter nyackensis]|uniref:Uncharacterized protein n=1 Tax=Pedobacter nyackensis TaxID=475255 RepID=A0A1W2EF11_9SPHI|nr:hypothetical protein [Pedobacter nyackensis]SMD08311.1 hypothetical protein SAMN04488101_1127 [Pedobacter nyackensis]